MAAMLAETGADLERLGSQAAWACYEDVWEQLGRRWRQGGPLARVRAGDVDTVRTLLARVPPWVAERAGADIGELPPRPLVIDGELRLDLDGLMACLVDPAARFDRRARGLIDELIACAG